VVEILCLRMLDRLSASSFSFYPRIQGSSFSVLFRDSFFPAAVLSQNHKEVTSTINFNDLHWWREEKT